MDYSGGTFSEDGSRSTAGLSRGGDELTRGPVSAHSATEMSMSQHIQMLNEGPTRFTFRFDTEYLERVQEAWETHVRGTPYANEATLGAVLRELGFNPTYGEIQEYLSAYDRHGDGTKVNFPSLCDIIKTYMQDNPASVFERQLIGAFRVFDDESEGYVGTHVIDRALHQLPCITKMTEIRELMSELDREGEGYISYEYFVSSLCTNYAKGLASAPAPQPLKFSKREVRDTLDGMIDGLRDDGADPDAAGAVIERRERVIAAWEQQEAERKASGGKKGGKKKGKKAAAAAAAAAAAEAAASVTAAAASEAATSAAAKIAAAKAAEAKARAEEDERGIEMQQLFNSSARGSFRGGSGRGGVLDANTFASTKYELDASEGSTEGAPPQSPRAAAAAGATRQRVAVVQEEDDELDGLLT